MEQGASDQSMSAIEPEYADKGERSHLNMGMGNCYSKRKWDERKTNAGVVTYSLAK